MKKTILAATLALAIAFTLGCEEKSSGKAEAEKAAMVAAAYIKAEREKALKEGRTFTDERDGKIYIIVKIGEQLWMAENLNYNANDSKCYGNQESNCAIYGRLYNWETAMESCPEGWYLPSDDEWQTLMDFVGGEKVAGKKLKAKSGWNGDGNGTDFFGFLALPSGNGDSGGRFYNVGNYGYWWNASENDYADFAYGRSMDYDDEDVDMSNNSKSDLLSVRCVKGAMAEKSSVDVLSWTRMSADKFGCMLEKTFGYKDERFNCSLKGYENNGDPCNNTDEYYEGPGFPNSLVKKVHPLLRSIDLNWEGGSLQIVFLMFDSEHTKKQMLKVFGLSSQESLPDNIMNIGTDYNPGKDSYSILSLTGFEHMGAGDVGCEDEEESATEEESITEEDL